MAAVFSLKVAGERFWFPDSRHTAVPFNIFYELIDALERFFILELPIDVVFPCII